MPLSETHANANYEDESACSSISSDEGGRVNVLRASEDKKVRKKKSDTKYSWNKKVLSDLPEFTPSKGQLSLYGRSDLDYQVDQLVGRNNDIAAE